MKERAIRRTCLPALSFLIVLSTMVGAQGPRLFSREWYAQFSGAYSQPVAPFRIVGNVYYVGAANIASYLIATAQGHILIDSGTTEMHDGIISSVERLGYAVSDIYSAAFFTTTTPNPGVPLFDNLRHPNVGPGSWQRPPPASSGASPKSGRDNE